MFGIMPTYCSNGVTERHGLGSVRYQVKGVREVVVIEFAHVLMFFEHMTRVLGADAPSLPPFKGHELLGSLQDNLTSFSHPCFRLHRGDLPVWFMTHPWPTAVANGHGAAAMAMTLQ